MHIPYNGAIIKNDKIRQSRKEWTKVHSSSLHREFLYDKKKEGIIVARRADIELRTEQLVQPIVDENHFELVDVEYVKEGANWYLRVYADKEGGINIDDCVLLSRALEAKLDEEDFIEDAYILEVSSPGLGRPLKKDKDFERSLGKDIEIKLYRPIEKRKEWEGTLVSYDTESITVRLEEKEMTIARNDIALVRLALDF